jgi:hypothetical protein
MARYILVLLALAAGTLTALASVDPGWAREAGLDFWNRGELAAWERAEHDRTLDLAADVEHCQRRREVLGSIVARLVDDQITLARAAEEVEQVAAADPEWFALLRDYYDNGELSVREIAARYLLRRVQAEGRAAEQLGQHDRAALVANRLTALEADSRVSLPWPRGIRR